MTAEKNTGANERGEAWLNAAGNNELGSRRTRYRKRVAWGRKLARTVESLRQKNDRGAR